MDVRFIGDGHGVDGHDITGTADQEAGTMTLTCACGRFAHTVHYRDGAMRALSSLADAGRDHLAFVLSLPACRHTDAHQAWAARCTRCGFLSADELPAETIDSILDVYEKEADE